MEPETATEIPVTPPEQPEAHVALPVNHQKLIRILGGIIILLLLALFGALYFLFTKQPALQSQNPSPITSIPTPKPTSTTTGTFDTFIEKYCADTTGVAHLLPLNFTPTALFSDTSSISGNCGGERALMQEAIVVGFDPNKTPLRGTLIVYDDNSTEAGRGGPPFLGTTGRKLLSKNGLDFYAYLDGPMGPMELGSISLELRVIKTLTQRSGKPMYVSFTKIMIPSNSSRIIDFTKPYVKAVHSEVSGDVDAVEDEEMYTNDLMEHFLNMENLAEPEKTEVQNIVDLLTSFSN